MTYVFVMHMLTCNDQENIAGSSNTTLKKDSNRIGARNVIRAWEKTLEGPNPEALELPAIATLAHRQGSQHANGNPYGCFKQDDTNIVLGSPLSNLPCARRNFLSPPVSLVGGA